MLRSVQKMPGGYNCTLYKITDEKGDIFIAKKYRDPQDRESSRLLVEYQALSFLWKHGVRSIPEPIAMSPAHSLGVYRFIVGTKLPKGTYTRQDISLALDFWRQLHLLKTVPGAAVLPLAKDACFSVAQYYESIDTRLTILAGLPRRGEGLSLHTFLEHEFVPVYKQIQEIIAARGTDIRKLLPKKHRTLSPSDFGFHNALRVARGQLVFVDFEYFGWDDPAKLVADFFLHPKMNFPYPLRKEFFDHVVAVTREDISFRERLARVYMLQSLRWVLIMLNVFRRGSEDGHLPRKQLTKAKKFLALTRTHLVTRPFPFSFL